MRFFESIIYGLVALLTTTVSFLIVFFTAIFLLTFAPIIGVIFVIGVTLFSLVMLFRDD